MDASRWQRASRLLCVRLDQLGDVLMTTPAVRALKESAPGRHVTLLTSPAAAEAARLVPEIDEVLTYDAPWMKATAPRDSPEPDRRFIETLCAGGFDAAVIFTVYSQNPLPAAMACYLAGIPLRLAYCHENPYQLLTDWVPDPEPAAGPRHEVRRQLDLVARIGCRASDEHLSLRVPGDSRRSALRRLVDQRVNLERPWIAVHPGASAPSRRYPPALYAEALRELVGIHGLQAVLTGSRDEAALCEEIRLLSGVDVVSLAGMLRFAELSAVIEAAPLLLANNTGPVHIAAAVGTPVVDLYALTNPQHTPWQVPNRVLSHDVPCRNCYKSVCPHGHGNCLALIEPREVVEAVVGLLGEARSE